MAEEYLVRLGTPCEGCRRDLWTPVRGRLRCACGRLLWIERVRDKGPGVRFAYRQGPVLPATYRSWSTVTG